MSALQVGPRTRLPPPFLARNPFAYPQIVVGVLCIVVNAVLIIVVVEKPDYDPYVYGIILAATGIWGGVLMVLEGFMFHVAIKTDSNGALLCFYLTAAFNAIIAAGVFACGLMISLQGLGEMTVDVYVGPSKDNTLAGLGAVMALLGLAAMVMSIGGVCALFHCRKTQASKVTRNTIPLENQQRQYAINPSMYDCKSSVYDDYHSTWRE